MQNLNIRELLTGEPNRLRHIIRFGNCHKVHRESVAEHSVFTVYYSMMIARWLEGRKPQDRVLSMDTLLQRAILHDMEEARSGDFPRPFKYSTPEIKAALDKASVFAFDQCMKATVSGDANDLDALRNHWERAKDESVEGRIVAFADYLSVVAYLWLEVRGSNLTMQQHVNDMKEYASEFEAEKYNFLRPLVTEATQLVKEFLESHGR